MWFWNRFRNVQGQLFGLVPCGIRIFRKEVGRVESGLTPRLVGAMVPCCRFRKMWTDLRKSLEGWVRIPRWIRKRDFWVVIVVIVLAEGVGQGLERRNSRLNRNIRVQGKELCCTLPPGETQGRSFRPLVQIRMERNQILHPSSGSRRAVDTVTLMRLQCGNLLGDVGLLFSLG